MSARILIYDIESTPSLGYTWGRYEQTVLKFEKHRELLSVSWKWYGEKEVQVETREGKKDDKNLTVLLRNLFQEADVIVAHNGNTFDQKVAKARMIAHGLKPVKQLASVDTRLAARRYFDFNGNSLNDLCGFFSIGSKLPTQGIDLWLGCMKDDPKAWAIMAKYNKHDVVLLDKIYERLRPWVENHPNIGRILKPAKVGSICPDCGSESVSKYGIRPTLSTIQQRWICKDCGKNFLTAYKKDIKS
jgi:hypothetical protein